MQQQLKSSLGGMNQSIPSNTLSPRDVHEHRLTGYNFQAKQSFDGGANNFNNSGYRKFYFHYRLTELSIH